MKVLIIFFYLGIGISFINGQCTQNTIPGSTINEFDWRTEYFDIWFIQDNQPDLSSISSPFFLTTSVEQYNVDHFAAPLEKNFDPEDGWEILFFNFGSSTEGVSEPYFALYNRYSGLLQYFMFLSANGESSYKTALITTYFSQLGNVYNNSALFESQNAFHHALDDFDKEVIVNTVNRYTHQNGTWIVSEWLTHYDPCTCLSELNMNFKTTLQNISLVDLSVEGNSSTVPIYSSTSDSNNGNIRSSLAKINDGIEFVDGAYKKGNNIYKNFSSFINVNQTKEEIAANVTIIKAIANIASGTATQNPIPIIAGVLSIVNTFVSTSSEKPTKTIISHSSKHTFEAEGTISLETPYPVAKFYVPGSNHTNFSEARVPTYDNVLGIASIIETPKILYLEDHFYDDWTCNEEFDWTENKYQFYQLKEDIKYTINESANINGNPIDVKIAMYFELSGNLDDFWLYDDAYSSELGIEELIIVNSRLLRTPYMNLSCLKNYPVVFQTIKKDYCELTDFSYNVRPYLSLALVLESNDIETVDIGYLASYIVEGEFPLFDWNDIPENQFIGIKEEIEVHFNDIKSDMQTWGQTIIIDPPGKTIVINNGDGESSIISLDTDNDPTTPIKYSTNEFTVDCGEVPTVSSSYLNTFCNSNLYHPIVEYKIFDHGIDIIKPRKIKIFPNPTSDILNVTIEGNELYTYGIYNMLGNKVMNGELNENFIDLNNLPIGCYTIYFRNNDKTMIYERFIKI